MSLRCQVSPFQTKSPIFSQISSAWDGIWERHGARDSWVARCIPIFPMPDEALYSRASWRILGNPGPTSLLRWLVARLWLQRYTHRDGPAYPLRPGSRCPCHILPPGWGSVPGTPRARHGKHGFDVTQGSQLDMGGADPFLQAHHGNARPEGRS